MARLRCSNSDAIGFSGSGAIFYWSYSLEARWDAEAAGREYLPDESSILELAPTFTRFLNQLTRVEEDGVPRLEELARTADNFAKYGDYFFDEAKAFLIASPSMN